MTKELRKEGQFMILSTLIITIMEIAIIFIISWAIGLITGPTAWIIGAFVAIIIGIYQVEDLELSLTELEEKYCGYDLNEFKR